MKERSIEWLRESVRRKTAEKVTVIGGTVGRHLIWSGRADLLARSGGLTGDGLAVTGDRFTFASHAPLRAVYPLSAVRPLYCRYAVDFADVAGVYEDGDGRPVVLLADPLDHDDSAPVGVGSVSPCNHPTIPPEYPGWPAAAAPRN